MSISKISVVYNVLVAEIDIVHPFRCGYLCLNLTPSFSGVEVNHASTRVCFSTSCCKQCLTAAVYFWETTTGGGPWPQVSQGRSYWRDQAQKISDHG